MIHHLSVAAQDPKAVADFFAALVDGVRIDFPPNPGSYMVLKDDGFGTGVEIYPAGSVLAPNGDDGGVFLQRPAADVGRSPTHFALSVQAEIAAVQALAQARGWACHICDRGGHFHVVEVWIENAWLVEVLPPAFAAEYLAFAGAASRMADPERALASHRAQPRTLENA
jgi:catechol 2,3-dioxygenase-like lactoylglutathione lyase family enzyme